MSSEKAVVALKLQSGETFDQVLVEDRSWTLATFLDAALKSLEVGSKTWGATYSRRVYLIWHYSETKCVSIATLSLVYGMGNMSPYPINYGS